ncbi:MAG: hypothetical protein R2818_11725 [Flavobacteriales bacterium]
MTYKHDGRDSSSLSNNRIWGLAEADERHLWVGTRSGLDRLDRRTGRFEQMHVGGPDGCWQVFDVIRKEACSIHPCSWNSCESTGKGRSAGPLVIWIRTPTAWRRTAAMIHQFQRRDTLRITHPQERTAKSIKLPLDTASEISSILRQGRAGCSSVDTHRTNWTRSTGGCRSRRNWIACYADIRVKHAERAPDGKVRLGISGHGVVVLDSALRIVQRYPLLPPEQRPLNITGDRIRSAGQHLGGNGWERCLQDRALTDKVGRMMPGQGLPWEPRSWFVRGFAQWDEHRVLVNFFQGGSALFDERDATLVPAPLDPRTFGASGDHGFPLRDGEGRIWMQEGHEIRCIDPHTAQVLHRFTAACGDRMWQGRNGEVLRISTCHPPEHLLPGPGPVRFRTGAMNAAFAAIAKNWYMPSALIQDGLGRY